MLKTPNILYYDIPKETDTDTYDYPLLSTCKQTEINRVSRLSNLKLNGRHV